MEIHQDSKAGHTEIIPHTLGKPGVAKLLELRLGVFKLLADDSDRENIFLAKDLGRLLAQEIFITADA